MSRSAEVPTQEVVIFSAKTSAPPNVRSEEHTSELQSHSDLHLSLHDALPICPSYCQGNSPRWFPPDAVDSRWSRRCRRRALSSAGSICARLLAAECRGRRRCRPRKSSSSARRLRRRRTSDRKSTRLNSSHTVIYTFPYTTLFRSAPVIARAIHRVGSHRTRWILGGHAGAAAVR